MINLYFGVPNIYNLEGKKWGSPLLVGSSNKRSNIILNLSIGDGDNKIDKDWHGEFWSINVIC